MLSEDETVRRHRLRHACHSVCRLADNPAKPEADATSTPSVALASDLSESMTAVGITHLPRGVSDVLVLVARHVGNMRMTDATEVSHL